MGFRPRSSLLLVCLLTLACSVQTACSSSDQGKKYTPKPRGDMALDAGDMVANDTDLSDLSGFKETDASRIGDLGSDPDVSMTMLPAAIEASHAWSVYTFCPNAWGAPDHLSGHDMFVRASAEDADQDVITFSLKVPLSAGGYPTAVAMGALDVKTGESLGCPPLPVQDAVVSDLTHFDQRTRTAFYAYHNNELEGGVPGPGGEDELINGVLGIDVDTGKVRLDHREPQRHRGDVPMATALAFAGSQVVSTPGMDRLVSLDARTGKVLWRLDGDVPGRPGEPWRITRLVTPSPETLFLLNQWKELYEVDATGGVTPRHVLHEAGGLRGPILLGGAMVLEESRVKEDTTKILKAWGGPVIHQESRCGGIFTMGPRRIGCTERTRFGTQLRIVAVDVDGANRSERTLTLPQDERRTIWPQIVALSPRHVLAIASGVKVEEHKGNSTSTPVLDAYILDMEDPKREPVHVEWMKTQKNLGSSLEPTPIFTRGGTVVVSRWGSFHGIQTNIPWTDRGPAPRGALVGNHHNLGYTLE